MEHWKVTMLGDGGVGKTALAVQFTQHQFIETYDPTIEDSYRRQVVVDDKMAFLEIIDTAGQDDYSTLREQWIREGQGFILVYSITNRQTFDNIERFRRTVLSIHPHGPVFLLIGNKIDDAYAREVTVQDALTYGRRIGADAIEASAKTAHNVEKLFCDIVRELREKARQGLISPGTVTASGSTRGMATRTKAGTVSTNLTHPSPSPAGSGIGRIGHPSPVPSNGSGRFPLSAAARSQSISAVGSSTPLLPNGTTAHSQVGGFAGRGPRPGRNYANGDSYDHLPSEKALRPEPPPAASSSSSSSFKKKKEKRAAGSGSGSVTSSSSKSKDKNGKCVIC